MPVQKRLQDTKLKKKKNDNNKEYGLILFVQNF